MSFQDHIVQNPNRYKIINNPDGTVTLTPTWIENPSEVIQQGTPLNADVFSGIDQQLADTRKKTGMDFVALLREHNEIPANIHVKVLANRKLEIAVPYNDDMCGYYLMEKDANDDYIKLKECSIQSVKLAENLYMKKNYETKVGSWVTSASPNIYTRVIGDTFSFSFNGTGFALNHYGDTRGGLWEFVIDGGSPIQISVYKPVTGSYQTDVVKGLTDGEHSVVATFKGADPANTPTDTARGWISESNVTYPDAQTISVYKPTVNGQKKFSVHNFNSNKDFAVSVAPAGSGLATNWLPEHGNIGTVFAITQEIWIDNNLVTDWTADIEMKPAKSVRVIQYMKGYHTSDMVNHLVEIVTIHTFNAGGVSIQGKFDFVRDTLCGSGYVMMFPVYPSFAKKLITNTGEVYETTKTDNTDTSVINEPTSFAFVNEGGTNGEPNILAAMTINNPVETFRVGKSGRRDPLFFINHRDTTIQKLYTMILSGHTMLAGEEIKFGGTFHIGEIPMASKLLI